MLWLRPGSEFKFEFELRISMLKKEMSNVQVVARVRPMSEREERSNTLPIVTASTVTTRTFSAVGLCVSRHCSAVVFGWSGEERGHSDFIWSWRQSTPAELPL